MKLVALMLARNEAWTLPASVGALMRWCDDLVVLNHASTDGTCDALDAIASEFMGRVHVIEERDPFFMEMTFRQRTLEKAREIGATHCATVDPDEILCEHMVPGIRDRIARLAPAEVLQIPWVILWRSLDSYRSDDGIWSRAYATFAFCDAPQLHWTAREHGYQHHHRHPFNTTHIKEGNLSDGGLLHFQHASWRRLLAKQALYQVNEILHYPAFTPEQIRSRYAPTVDESGLQLSPVPCAWWGPEKAMIELEEEPWQEAEVRRLVEQHGRSRFDGVNLFGVA